MRDKGTSGCTPQERETVLIHEFLERRQAYGQAAAVLSEEIMRGCAISSKRELCSLVERERREGLPVLSTKRGHGGYYLPADRTETEACVKRLRTEAASINAIADALENVPDAALSSNDNATPHPQKDR